MLKFYPDWLKDIQREKKHTIGHEPQGITLVEICKQFHQLVMKELITVACLNKSITYRDGFLGNSRIEG